MKIKENFKIIFNHYNKLVEMTNKHLFVGIVNEWLIDNYYLVLEQKRSIDEFVGNRKIKKFATKNVNIYSVIESIVLKNNYRIDQTVLINELNKYQEENKYNFLYEELALVNVILSIIVIDKISKISLIEGKELADRNKIDKIILNIKRDIKNSKNLQLSDYFSITSKTSDNFIVYLSEQIKELGKYSSSIFKQLDKMLIKNNLFLRDIINQEHLANTAMSLCVTNTFYTLNNISEIKIFDIFDKVSINEKILEKDKYYSKMTDKTKELYRNQLIKEAKKQKKDIFTYTKELIKNDEHIGYELFKSINTNKRIIWYTIILALLTTTTSILLSKYFLHSRILGTLLLLIPISEIIIILMNKILMRIFPCKPLPELDFTKDIPENNKTMVVVPTIVNNINKVDSVFDNLETYYLSNRSNNLYFTLLADCSESSTEKIDIDSEILSAGINKVKLLNTKYNKNIFYFVYRNRMYNQSEESWLGYERKRGALLHFNDLILGNLNEKEQNKYFCGHTFHDFTERIKYVITLDVDTKLVLNSAKRMVGIMAHPLNKPILNGTNSLVIKGYALMQPKVTIDINSTNKSLFSQIYAGIGGFDSYNNICPNFYQDVFGEGSFIGKGIYDLEVFQEVLKNKFPQNLILSHDLIEGSYLRCANISNVELIDDFPSKFMVDATRRSRWARGDFQIVDWLTRKVKNAKNESVKNIIPLLAQWKILDNIRRGLFDLSLLLILFAAFTIGIYNPFWWVFFVVLINMFPIVFQILGMLKIKKTDMIRVKYYNVLTFGNKALILKTISMLATIPFNAYLYINSFLKAAYRMFISKKHLLNWITSEQAEKTVNSTFENTVKQFWPNYLFSILLILFTLIYDKYVLLSLILSLLFCLAPVITYIISSDIKRVNNIIDPEENNYVFEIAKKTWRFFDENINEENNYLIPDNYQLNRSEKQDIKTSPTNIGLSLTSIISAYELELINEDKAITLIKNIISTILKLKKWNGHLYNWYNIRTLEVMYPHFVSSVDSGNFVAGLIVTKEFLLKHNKNEIAYKVDNIIKKTNFTKLFNEKEDLSVGYNDDEGRLEPYSYNRFASESRIGSFIAIAKGDVSLQHWFNLDKTLTTHNNSKGLISWYGTLFEYFMPLIFMPTYQNTLLDETYHFAYNVQKDFIKEVDPKLPWGISESAYNELDDSQNYKYKDFGVPCLKLKEEPIGRIVISPYSSILAITRFPKEVISNMKQLQNYDLLGDYGFFESYDAEDKVPVYSYFAHHQGMIMSSITNYIKNNILQKYFFSDLNNKTFEILIKEKTQLHPIVNIKSMKYKKYTYDKESFITDLRVFDHLSVLPQISILSNSKYTLLINDRGNGFSRYRTIQLNRYRKITEQDYGMFLYIKDLNNQKIWSNTYAPTNITPEKYEVVYNLDRIKFVRKDDEIITTTEIVVTKIHNAEVRKITFKNVGKKTKCLELTSYTEPILCNNNDDITHRVFNNMFVSTDYDEDTNSIIMKRKSKTSSSTYYMINRLLIENPTSEYQYETDRTNFIGVNHSGYNPQALFKPLSNYIGTVLDPVISLRNRITIEKGKEETIYLITGFGKSKEQVMSIINSYNNKESINSKAFQVSTIMTNITNKMVNITSGDMRIYNMMLNYLYQTSRFSINKERLEHLRKNTLNQTNLWKYGISGDIPIIFVDIQDIKSLSLVKELLHAFEYYKSKSIFIDLVFLNVSDKEESKTIEKEIEDEKYHMYAINSFNKIPGNIYVLNRNDVSSGEYSLFTTIARLKIDANKYLSLYEFINDLQKSNTIVKSRKIITKETDCIEYNPKDLKFFNEYGGFSNDGKEYTIINRNTPTVWSNVISNEKFGTIVTNNNCGFTYFYNSNDYKITSWTNDALLNDHSECIKINNMDLNYNIVKHGFGYSEYQGILDNLEVKYTTFVSEKDTIKLYKLNIKNISNNVRIVNFNFWINPTLGVAEDKTSRHLLCEFDKDNNYVSIRNVYSIDFSNVIVFMSCNEQIKKVKLDGILYKEIESEFNINKNEEKEIIFMLGATSPDNVLPLLKKYQDIKTPTQELTNVKKSWDNSLNQIKVNTPDKSFDYMLNGWLLYQTMSSRIYAKAGFYQVSGAFGFRDQLQDAMNICISHPEITREQIIINASHQFKTGDVLHWWHEYNHFGLRSLYKDDYLWLIYAVSEYTKITGDYEILDVKIPFVKGDSLKENETEKGINFTYSDETSSLFEHCKLAIEKSMNELGSNGLPLMGGGDWNDGMNKIGIKGKGTSVWLGFFLYLMIEKFTDIIKKYDEKFDINSYINFNQKLKKSLEKKAWDGSYYMRAFFDNGNKLGSKENKECSIDLISQCFSLLTNITTDKKTNLMLKSIDEELADHEINIIKLINPPFVNSEDDPGYIMNYPKGIRENGGQYTHAVSWYIMALIKISKTDEAFKIYQMINPINRTLTKEMVEKYKVEPYVIAADIYSNPDYYGRGGWTWYTGSAGWFYKIGLVDILGFNKIGDKLYIKPNIPSYWDKYNIEYKYGNSIYKIEVNNNVTKQNILLDDNLIEKDYIDLNDDGKNHVIVINIGDKNDKI